MNDRDNLIIQKIREEAKVINELVAACSLDRDGFLGDEKTKRAVCMTLINIGELVKLLTDEFKKANSVIPWRKISGLRDVAAHGYFALRMEDIWETITSDIPALVNDIERMSRM